MKIRGLVFAALLVIAGSFLALSQDRKSPELTVEQSKHIPPFPPKDVKVRFQDKHAVITWTKVPSERVVAYEIYRTVNGGALEKIGRAKEPPFTDEHPANGRVEYSVAAVDFYENVSRPRSTEKK